MQIGIANCITDLNFVDIFRVSKPAPRDGEVLLPFRVNGGSLTFLSTRHMIHTCLHAAILYNDRAHLGVKKICVVIFYWD